MELDLYASYGRSFGRDWSWRAGLYGYLYPGGNLVTLKYQLTAQWTLSGLARATNAAFYRHTASLLDPGETDNVGGTRGFVMVQGTF
jgi:hypothetical protein